MNNFAVTASVPKAQQPATKIGKLTLKKRKALPVKVFAGPDRSYPVPDASHAANAKARATQQVNAGNLSPGSKAKIDAKANRVLKAKRPKVRP